MEVRLQRWTSAVTGASPDVSHDLLHVMIHRLPVAACLHRRIRRFFVCCRISLKADKTSSPRAQLLELLLLERRILLLRLGIGRLPGILLLFYFECVHDCS